MQYVEPEQQKKLPRDELFQRALDSYIARRKSNWEIGRDYERFIGYQFESNGYDVSYYGATKGLEDMGRDLIAIKNRNTKIIQCKYWAQGKVIHEKHIFQLFGTSVLYAALEHGWHPDGAFATLRAANVSPTFICSCELSDVAKKAASSLGVVVRENMAFDSDYPRIKCNYGKNGEKIYHLPFDQMYDRVKILDSTKECYVKRVKEAENLGYRRAWKWRGN